MLPTCQNVGAPVSGNGSDVVTVASFTLAANTLGLLVVSSVDNLAIPEPVITGTLNVTWVLVDDQPTVATQMRTWIFRAMDGSDQTGTVIVTFVEGQFTLGAFVDEWDNVVTSGSNGADAIEQVVKDTAASGTALAAGTLAAFGNSSNATYVVGTSGIVSGAPTLTKEAAHTETAQFNESGGPSTSDHATAAAYLIGEDNGPGYTSSVNTDWICIGLEINALLHIESVSDGGKAGESVVDDHTAPESETDGGKAGESVVDDVTAAESATDGAKAGDSEAESITATEGISDGANAGDSEIHSTGVVSDSVSDGAKAGDSQVDILSLAAESVSDGGKTGEVFSGAIVFPLDPEGASAGELVDDSLGNTFPHTRSDGASGGDDHDGSIIFPIDDEGGLAGDSQTNKVTADESVSDGGSAGETVDDTGFGVGVRDGGKPGDSISVDGTFKESVADGGECGEALDQDEKNIESVSDGAKAGDSETEKKNPKLGVTDGGVSGDFVASEIAGIVQLGTVDRALVGDSVSIRIIVVESISTGGMTSDLDFENTDGANAESDGGKGGDSVLEFKIISDLVSDGVKGGDSGINVVRLSEIISDGSNSGDTVLAQVDTERLQVIDTALAGDTAVVVQKIRVSVSDSAVGADLGQELTKNVVFHTCLENDRQVFTDVFDDRTLFTCVAEGKPDLT